MNTHKKTRKSPQKNFSSPSSASPPAVPLFYTSNYADPPDCAELPLPPSSWYLPPSTCSRPNRRRTHQQTIKTVRFLTAKA